MTPIQSQPNPAHAAHQMPETLSPNLCGVTAPLQILYQDDVLVAIHKPAGMLVHRSFLDKHETVFVLQQLRNQLGRHVFPLHRLDRPTSGLLWFAFDADTARLMQQGEPWRKYYLALVRGHMTQAMVLDYPLQEQLDAIADKKARDDKAPQAAQTAIWPVASTELPFATGRYVSARFSVVLLQAITGRKHQLRRHLAHLRHPIIGDTSHGDNKLNRAFRDFTTQQGLLLHAYHTQLRHPYTGEWLCVTAPLPWLAALTNLGFSSSCEDAERHIAQRLSMAVEPDALRQLNWRYDE